MCVIALPRKSLVSIVHEITLNDKRKGEEGLAIGGDESWTQNEFQ